MNDFQSPASQHMIPRHEIGPYLVVPESETESADAFVRRYNTHRRDHRDPYHLLMGTA
jgi:hypothetical protein